LKDDFFRGRQIGLMDWLGLSGGLNFNKARSLVSCATTRVTVKFFVAREPVPAVTTSVFFLCVISGKSESYIATRKIIRGEYI